jgi:hypothetical protein
MAQGEPSVVLRVARISAKVATSNGIVNSY